MAVASHWSRDGFLIENLTVAEADFQTKTLSDNLLKHLQLNRTHNVDLHFLQALIPDDLQHRVLVLKLLKSLKHGSYVQAFIIDDAGGQQRHSRVVGMVQVFSNTIPRPGGVHARHSTEIPGRCFRHRSIPSAAVNPNLVYFLPDESAFTVLSGHYLVFNPQFSRSHLDKAQAAARAVVEYLVHMAAERLLCRAFLVMEKHCHRFDKSVNSCIV